LAFLLRDNLIINFRDVPRSVLSGRVLTVRTGRADTRPGVVIRAGFRVRD